MANLVNRSGARESEQSRAADTLSEERRRMLDELIRQAAEAVYESFNGQVFHLQQVLTPYFEKAVGLAFPVDPPAHLEEDGHCLADKLKDLSDRLRVVEKAVGVV